MKIKTVMPYKSIPSGLEFDLPDLTVITGINGSGKSHLLEAINSKKAQVTEDGRALERIVFIPFGGLIPQVNEQGSQQDVINQLKGCWESIFNVQSQARKYIQDNNFSYGDAEANSLGNNLGLKKIVSRLLKRTRKDSFLELTEDDVLRLVNISELADNGLFFAQFAQIFKSYMVRLQKNEYNEYRNNKKGKDISYLSDEEFEREYGPKPWVLVNNILEEAGLSYRVSDPEDTDMESDFRLRLVDRQQGLEISVNDMSTGEKVLMSLALAIYNSNESGTRPDILLIDEPDAALHPHYSKILINTLKKSIVDIAKTKVILTTHSPTTVAMCPDGAIYQISKSSKVPAVISISEALSVLTEGIPHLKVSVENRLQVFVESKYDVAYYERMHNLLRRKYEYSKLPVFLAPHSRDSNCTDVIDIVTKLAAGGSDLVRGIIDWDGSNVAAGQVFIMGLGNRYSIENYILDPIYICLALVRGGKKQFSDFGVSSVSNYVLSGGLSNSDVQAMADYVMTRLGLQQGSQISCDLDNGYSVSYSADFLNMRGHDYEELLLKVFPELNSLKRGNGDSGLKLGVLGVIEEFSEFISVDWSSTFEIILGRHK
jgi:predicted ATPase